MERQMDALRRLAELNHARTRIDNEIAALLGRPALRGHAGEYLAAAIFDIHLAHSATNKGSDGTFRSGPLADQSVNVKWYAQQQALLDINPNGVPDYYLVLTGPRASAVSSRGTTSPWVIDHVYLFSGLAVIAD